MAQVWSQWMLSKGFFDPVSGTSYKLHREYSELRPACLPPAFAGQLVQPTSFPSTTRAIQPAGVRGVFRIEVLVTRLACHAVAQT